MIKKLRIEALEKRELLSVCVWDGGNATNHFWTSPDNWVGGVTPIAGDSLVFPQATDKLTSLNDFPSGTTFDNITIEANYKLPNELPKANTITVKSNSTFETSQIFATALVVESGGNFQNYF